MSDLPQNESVYERLIEDLSALSERPELSVITQLAAVVSGAPVSLLGVFHHGGQKILSSWRWKVTELPSETVLANWALTGAPEGIAVADTVEWPEFARDPFVLAEPKIRSFATVPLHMGPGPAIGCLSVFGQQPSAFSRDQMTGLRALGVLATSMLELLREAAAVEKVKEALTESESRSRDLFEVADDLIMSIDTEGRLVHVNHAGLSALGYEQREIVRLSIFDLIHPDARLEFSTTFREVTSTGARQKVETQFLANSGRRITVDGTLIPKMLDERAALIRVIFRDISDRKRFEIELGQARDAALEAARLKTQFLTNVTHEVRTPMNVIVGMLDLLLSSQLTAEQKDLIQTAQASSRTLLELIGNILHVSTLESGSLSVTTADFDPMSAVKRVVEVMKVMAEEKNLVVEATFDEKLPPVLRGDVARFRQVLTNLVSNAIKFTDKGRIDVLVGIERETATHVFVKIEVADTGIGVPAEAIPHLFDTFYQVDPSAKRRFSGLGLGLGTVQKIVELMNGAVGVTSQEGKGSRFWFTVPFEKRAARDIAIAARKSAVTGTKAMLYDGSATSRKIIMQYLSAWGVRCRPARTMYELWDRVRGDVALGDPYRVVLIDMHGLEQSGLEVAREIRSNPALRDTSVILLVSLGEPLNDEELREAGVHAYLTKPVEQSELFDCLMSVMARSPGAVAAVTPAVETTAQPGTPATLPKGDGVRILIAEDKPLNQKLMKSQLRNLGFEADTATDGDEALAAVREKSYDIIFMDCQMPVRDGYETTMEIRRLEGDKRRVRIIAMTANAREGDRERCLAAGMDDYLSKPTTQKELEAALMKWVRREPRQLNHL